MLVKLLFLDGFDLLIPMLKDASASLVYGGTQPQWVRFCKQKLSNMGPIFFKNIPKQGSLFLAET